MQYLIQQIFEYKSQLKNHDLHTQINHNLSCGMVVLNSAIQAIEAKDQYTRGHSDRVSQITLKLAVRIEPELAEQDVEVASKLHDIGKIGVSELVLTKPTGLTGDEIEMIRKHPDMGANSRIIAVADTYDALTSNRPYRRALPPEQALKIIVNARSSQLDPLIVDSFLVLHQDLLHKKTS